MPHEAHRDLESLHARLPDLLRRINRIRARQASGRSPEEERIEAAFGPSRRFAVYGSLVPGGSNHHVVAGLKGAWKRGVTRGRLERRGWGSELGYPGFIWDPEGPEVEVHVLESLDLREAWPRFDRFEGPDYLRILVPVRLEGGTPTVANLYAIRGGNDIGAGELAWSPP